jgi:hypothetical protein
MDFIPIRLRFREEKVASKKQQNETKPKEEW